MMLPGTLPRAVTIHGLGHARAALAPGLPVLLLSAYGAAGYAGAGWWRALIAAAQADSRPSRDGTDQPDALDCADEPGRALEALFVGCRIVVLHPCPASAAVAERAEGALILTARPPSLDLGDRSEARHLVAWLEGDTGRTFG